MSKIERRAERKRRPNHKERQQLVQLKRANRHAIVDFLRDESARVREVNRNPASFLETLPELRRDGMGVAIVALEVDMMGRFSETVPIGVKMEYLGPSIESEVPASEYLAYRPSKADVLIEKFSTTDHRRSRVRAAELRNQGWKKSIRAYPESIVVVGYKPTSPQPTH